MNSKDGMSFIVKTVTKLTIGLILLYGAYIVLHGHVSPGGGFAGGVIIALSFIHMMLAFGKGETLKRISKPFVSVLESVGALLFLTIPLLGFMTGYFFKDWFVNKGKPFHLFSGGTIPLSNIAISLKVSMGLFAIFFVLVLLKSSKRK